MGRRRSRRTRRSSQTRRPRTRSTATPGTSSPTSSGTRATFPHALDAFKKTIDYGTQFPQLPNAAKLADSARRDVIPVYALAGSPTEAYNFFKTLSRATRPATTEKTFKMMDDLGQNYLDTGHYPEAIALYKDLMVRDCGERQRASTSRT